MFDESKHFRGYHGRWAKGADRSREQLGGLRAAGAFHPRKSAAEVRARKSKFTTRVSALLDTRDRVARGDNVSWRDEQNVSWSSPRKVAEQRRKTGDALIPRAEIARKERRYSRAVAGQPARTGLKRTFSGKVKVERGNYRQYEVPSARGGVEVKHEDRVRRRFDWKPAAKHPRKAKPKPAEAGYIGRRRREP